MSKERKHRRVAFFFSVLVWGSLALGIVALWYGYDLPNVHHLKGGTRQPSISVFSEDGALLATYGDLFGQPVRLQELPRYVPTAFIAIEDRRFYNHFGVDLIGLIRAAHKNFYAGHVVQGGSTITQQVAKNLFLSGDRSLRRKIQEALLALWLEHTFNKEEILTIYLNRVYFGAGAYGIEAAALRYFGKSARELSLREAALLAGTLKAPSRYSPLYNPEAAARRSAIVLALMTEAEMITPQEARSALHEPVKVMQLARGAGNCRYFTDWVLEMLPEYVSVDTEDLFITTTLNTALQQEASLCLQQSLEQHAAVHQGAIICFDGSGAVKAFVGGVDYTQSQFNRVLALRSAGSAFKLFVYLAALESGMTPGTMIADTPISIGKWHPGLFRWKPRGKISLNEAFAYSVNPVSVRLVHTLGRNRIVKLARRLGISTRQPHDLTVALGSGEVTLLELSGAYATVCADGHRVTPFAVRDVTDRKGHILYHYTPLDIQVLPTDLCQKMKILLRSVIDYGTGKRAKLNVPVLGKTGTSNDSRDAWFVATAGGVTTGVWLGNDNRAPMKDVTGGKLPAEIWRDFMQAVLGGHVRALSGFSEIAPTPDDLPTEKPLETDRKKSEQLDALIDEMEEIQKTSQSKRIKSSIEGLLQELGE
ncbi:MAG: PBP1A family penicillin-binding protein [Holosporales bacterium]|nr:PBP1A family penicillin-binding protein [Holosporales bacterium]